MAKSLVIVESPAKCRTINKYLGPGYVVKASMGHVRDLPKSKLGIDVENNFAPQYINMRDKTKVIADLRKHAKPAERVYIATDYDREGEAIAWHLCKALSLPDEKVSRVTFNEITKKAIKSAFESLHSIDLGKVNAQQARRVLDRLVGYKLSPLLWKKVGKGLSAGRVQSVAVMLIVDREREIRAFKAEEYWKVTAHLAPSADGAEVFTALLFKVGDEKAQVTTGEQANAICGEAKSLPFVVQKVDRKERRENPSPPFITSTLQQRASTGLGFSAKKTMVLAQQLYEGVEMGEEGSVALITYMRTDSVHLSQGAVDEARGIIEKEFGPKYLPEKPAFYRSGRDAQGAHEAIRPTEPALHPDSVKKHLNTDQWKLYNLIWRRFIACQMTPAVFHVTVADVAAGKYIFRATGRKQLFDGFLRVAGGDDRSQEQMLPAFEAGQRLHLRKLEPTQHFTQPPPRFTEATLVRVLEGKGIGRPSTYAPIISTIQDRGYVRQESRRFFATELGELVTDKLVGHFPKIINTDFTRGMEEKLDAVEEGRTDWVDLIAGFYEIFSADLEKARENMESEKGKPVETDIKCDKCGKPMVSRWSRHGKFLGCSGYPDCKNTMQLDDNGEVEEAEKTDEKCDLCGSPMLVKTGRRGKFLGCSNYPDCKNTRPIGAEKIEIPPELKKCDKCGADMVVKFSRRGPFIACSAYPQCKNAKPVPGKGKPEGKSQKQKASSKKQKDSSASSASSTLNEKSAKSAGTREISGKRKAAGERQKAEEGQQATGNGQQEETTETCEKCGATLVLREGRWGAFLACPNYPKCKFTKKVKQ